MRAKPSNFIFSQNEDFATDLGMKGALSKAGPNVDEICSVKDAATVAVLTWVWTPLECEWQSMFVSLCRGGGMVVGIGCWPRSLQSAVATLSSEILLPSPETTIAVAPSWPPPETKAEFESARRWMFDTWIDELPQSVRSRVYTES